MSLRVPIKKSWDWDNAMKVKVECVYLFLTNLKLIDRFSSF